MTVDMEEDLNMLASENLNAFEAIGDIVTIAANNSHRDPMLHFRLDQAVGRLKLALFTAGTK